LTLCTTIRQLKIEESTEPANILGFVDLILSRKIA